MAKYDGKKTAQDIRNAENDTEAKKILDDAIKQMKSESSGKQSEKELANQKAYNKVLQETAELVGNVSAAKEAQYKILEQELKSNKELQDALKKAGKSMKDLAEGMKIDLGEGNEELQKQILGYQEIHQLQEGQKVFGKQQKALLGDIAGAIGLNVRMEETFLGKVGAVSKGLLSQGEAQDQAMKALTANFKDIFNWQNITLSIFTKIAEATMLLVKQFDESRASLAAATGTGYEFQDVLFASQREANLLGVSMADAGKATAVLFDSTSNFVKVSQSAQKEMIKTTAMLDKLGVDAGTASETFQFLNLNLGMTATEATRTQKSLAMMGTNIGISTGKITKDFNAALPTLAVYGKQSVEVFKGLAAQAKAAGVETSALLGIAKQFDTFSGAATGVAKMNALLGTQLSTTEMLMMNEEDRIKTLIEQVQMQGVAFGDMDKYTQMAIANAAGIQDINEAQKIFGMNLADYEANKKMMDKNSEAQKKFEEAVQKTVPVMTQFMNLFTEIVTTAQPILEFLGGVAEKLTTFMSDLDTETKELFFGITALTTGLPALIAVMLTAGKAFLAWISWIGLTGTAVEKTSKKGEKASKNIGKSFKRLAKDGSASMKFLAKGLAKSTSMIGKGISTAFTTIGTGIGAMFSAIGTGVAAAVTAISGAIVAFPGVGAGVFAAIAGTTMLALSAVIAAAAAISAVVSAEAAYARAIADTAKEKRKMSEVQAELAKTSTSVLQALVAISTSNFSAATAGMRGLLKVAKEFDSLSTKSQSTIENLALISAGKAKDSMTGTVVTANTNNIITNVENIFKNMKMVVKIGEGEFEGYVTEIAEKAVVN